MSKHARPDHPIHDLLARRWSPYAFDDRPVSAEDALSLFEAARWAASSYNEQPWRFIAALRTDAAAFEKVLSCLVEANRQWAQHAGLLALGVIRTTFSRNDKPNRVALHDLGLAAANLTFEATARGLYVHQMAGIDPDAARRLFHVPEGHEVATAIAVGYRTPDSRLSGELRERETSPRARKALREFVFGDDWNEPAAFVPVRVSGT